MNISKSFMYHALALCLLLGLACQKGDSPELAGPKKNYFQKNWTVIGYHMTELGSAGSIVSSNDIAVQPYSYFYFMDDKVFCVAPLLTGQGTVKYEEGTIKMTLTNMGSITFNYTTSDQDQVVLTYEEPYPGQNTLVHRITLSRTAF